MLVPLRAAHLSRTLPRITTRHLATVQSSVPAPLHTHDNGTTPQRSSGLHHRHRIPVDPHHGLYHFFRQKVVDGAVRYETVESPDIKLTGTPRDLRVASSIHCLQADPGRPRNCGEKASRTCILSGMSSCGNATSWQRRKKRPVDWV